MITSNHDSLTMAALAACAGGALGLALLAQYGFDLWPCTICYWQRVPYGFVLALTALALMPVVDAPSRQLIVLICAGLFLIGAGLGMYHVGVEARWWPGPTECAGRVLEYSVNDLMAALNQPGRTGCEDPAFVFLGVSMAGYNVIASLGLTIISLWAAGQKTWWNDQR